MGRWDDSVDYDDDPHCPECDQAPCECDIDVCQNCGGYFTWTRSLAATWRERWKPKEGERQPQRCRRCLIDECWVEDRDE